MTDKAKGFLVALPVGAVVTLMGFVFSRGKSEAFIEAKVATLEARQAEDRANFKDGLREVMKYVEQSNRRLYQIQHRLGMKQVEPIESSEE